MKSKTTIAQNVLLLVAGTILVLVSASILTSPFDFYASNDIELGPNASLLNELKAPTGLLLSAGVFMISAIYVQSQAETALRLAALIYLSYATSRFVSMVSDGLPAMGLVQAATLEGTVGLACLAVLMIRRLPARKLAKP